jgi:hypothetical protein
VGQPAEVKIHGIKQLHSAFKQYDEKLKRELEAELLEAARIVASDAIQRFSTIDARSASGFRPRLRGFGRVVVEQRRRKTSGKRSDFGSLQMRRALIPAMGDNQARVIEHLDDMLDRIGRREGF